VGQAICARTFKIPMEAWKAISGTEQMELKSMVMEAEQHSLPS
jgi:hypothetical protein